MEGMRRFYLPPAHIRPPFIHLTGAQAHHLLHVLRLGVGAEVEIFDGQGRSYISRIVRRSREGVCCQVLEERLVPPKQRGTLILGQGIPRGEKMRWIIEKATELGVDVVIPLQTSRTVPQRDAEQMMRHQERWQRIAQEAARQCGRVYVPVIYPCTPWEAFLSQHPESLEEEKSGTAPEVLKLLCWEGASTPLRSLLPPQSPVHAIIFVVGPEGGFSEEEVSQAVEHGFAPVSLGPRLLRTETVALTMLTLLQFLYGDLG
ncbi:MAG: 16S rRNA (uracil(1498)-N(3))-methyltransferase [Nitrospinota bacterium]|nr:MAG: 16S rRNA (uracil(1498)-N(3))-methyltransferase [Nitrospinota bacterium]